MKRPHTLSHDTDFPYLDGEESPSILMHMHFRIQLAPIEFKHGITDALTQAQLGACR